MCYVINKDVLGHGWDNIVMDEQTFLINDTVNI